MGLQFLANLLGCIYAISILVFMISVPIPNIMAFMLLLVPVSRRRRRYIVMMFVAFVVTGISDIASALLVYRMCAPAGMIRCIDDGVILYLWLAALSFGVIAIAVNVYVRLNYVERRMA